MHHRSRPRQLIATATLAALVAGSWAPTAFAQAGQPSSGGSRPAAAPSPRTAPAQGQPAPASPATPEKSPGKAPQQTPSGPQGSGAAAPETGNGAAGTEAAPLTDEERRNQARAAFEAAQKAYEEQNYALAYDQFRRAYELIPSPHAEYWMASSLDLQGREREAARAYQTFLSHPAAQHVGEDKMAEARARLAELQAKLPARVTVTTEPAGAQVSVDGQIQAGTTPLTVELPAGTHRIEASLPGYVPLTTELQVAGGDDVEQRMALEAEPPPPPPVEEAPAGPATAAEPAERSMLPAYITLGLAGAGVVTGTLFGLKALSDRSDFNDNPTTKAADDVERNALIADMAFGVAITLGITGIVLLTSDDTEAEQTAKAKKKAGASSFAFAPVVSPQLGGAAARFTF
jgi:hypothetical protein